MADCDIFREQLAIKYPLYGHALWEPSPRDPDKPVQVGDVGFIRRGKFHRLFNALLSENDPIHERGVPEYHEPLVPNLSDHLDIGSLDRNHYCSAGVCVELDPGYHSRPGDIPQVTFQYNRTRGAAVSSLPVAARREDTLALGAFKSWIVKHIDSWFAFAQKLELGIERMEEIILVTGCDRTKSWANIAFLGNQADSQVSFGVRVESPDPRITFQFSPGNAQGAVLRHGPEGENLPENQCVFIRGYRVARSFWKLQRRVKAAAGPSPDPEGYDSDPDMEVISIPATTKYRDPLYLLLDYIAEQASDCDMVLAHDDDLAKIDGLGLDSSLETLKPDVMMDLLRRSNMEIHKVPCVSATDSSPNTDTSVVKVAMLSMKSQNRDIGPRCQGSRLVQNIDLSCASELRIPGSFPVPTTRGHTSALKTSLPADSDHGDGVPSTLQDLSRFEHATEHIVLALGNELSNIWSSLSKFAHVERITLMTAVVIIGYVVSLPGWVFSFTWDVIMYLLFEPDICALIHSFGSIFFLRFRVLFPRHIVPLVSMSFKEVETLLKHAEAIDIPHVSEYRTNLAILHRQFLQMRTESRRYPGFFHQFYPLLLCGLTWRLYGLKLRVDAIRRRIELFLPNTNAQSATTVGGERGTERRSVVSSSNTAAVPTRLDDRVINYLAKETPAIPGGLERNMQDIVEPVIPGPSKHREPQVEIAYPYHMKAHEENTGDTMERSSKQAAPHSLLKHSDSKTDTSVASKSSSGAMAANTRTQSKGFQGLVEKESVTKSPFRHPAAPVDNLFPPPPPPPPPKVLHTSHLPTPTSSASPGHPSSVSKHLPRLRRIRHSFSKRDRRKAVTFDETCDVVTFERDDSLEEEELFSDDGEGDYSEASDDAVGKTGARARVTSGFGSEQTRTGFPR